MLKLEHEAGSAHARVYGAHCFHRVTRTVGHQMSSNDTKHQQKDAEEVEQSRMPTHQTRRDQQGRGDLETQIPRGAPPIGILSVGLQLQLAVPRRTAQRGTADQVRGFGHGAPLTRQERGSGPAHQVRLGFGIAQKLLTVTEGCAGS